MPDVIDSFDGEFGWLSNFHVEKDDTTVEHEFAAAKTHDLGEKAKILAEPTPGRAKHRGRRATIRPDWDGVKVQIMRDLVFRKFWDDPELAEKLVETGDALLIEGNSWHDNFWGLCLCENCRQTNHPNNNNLGRILMEIRTLIQTYDD